MTDELDIRLDGGIGHREADCGADFVITVNADVYREIEEYAGSDTTKELGGVLLGRVVEDDGRHLVLVEGQIAALFTEAFQGSVTFTHESWDYMHTQRETRFPDLKIIGWYHTHPGFGIFLSSYDLFIQQNFFDIAWQVAYVVDPVNRRQGFFRWQGDQIVPCGHRLDPEPPEALPEQAPPPQKRPARARRWPIAAAAAAALILLASWLVWGDNGFWRSGAEQEQAPAPRQAPAAPPPQATQAKYRVKPGDTLTGISLNFYGTAGQADRLAKANGIADPDLIIEGQELAIPGL